MLRALAFGIGVGVGVAFFTGRPPLVESHLGGFFVLALLVLVVTYFAGRSNRSAHAEATAVAVASSEARASNVVHVNIDRGAAAMARSEFGGLDYVQLEHRDGIDALDGDADELGEAFEDDPESFVAGARGQGQQREALPALPAALSHAMWTGHLARHRVASSHRSEAGG